MARLSKPAEHFNHALSHSAQDGTATPALDGRASRTAHGIDGHAPLDLGADEYAKGKPHPMIDPLVRDRALIDALESERTAVILTDIVIGFGSHHDPAGHLVALFDQRSKSGQPPIIASVTGTDADPQGRAIQVANLENAGICVAPSNAEAATWARTAIPGNP